MSDAFFDAQEVFRRSRAAQKDWSLMSVPARLVPIKKLQKILALCADQIVDTIASDVKKVPVDILSGDIFVSLELMKYYRKNAARLLRARKIGGGGPFFWTTSTREIPQPYGTVLVLGPWNYPLQLSLLPAITALLCGNSVILKMSEVVPALTLLLEKLVMQAGFPPDLLQIVSGDAKSGEALIAQRPDKIFLTGSSQTGAAILRQAAPLLIPVELELGGKDAMIVFADAPFERSVNGAVYGAFSNAGQVCVSTKRLFVEASLYDKFVDALKKKISQLRIGSDYDCDYGPMARGLELSIIERQVKDAIAKGARLETPLKIEGQKIWPVLLSGVNSDAEVYAHESFGPLLYVAPFTNVNEVVELANASEFGLSASVWTSDRKKAKQVAERLECGSVHINDVIKGVAHPGASFGGFKRSGFGAYHGEAGLRAFSRSKVIHTNFWNAKKEINWFPFSQKSYRFMKKWIEWRFSIFLLAVAGTMGLLPPLQAERATAANLKVHVTSLPNNRGQLGWALFATANGFPGNKNFAFRRGFIKVPNELELRFEILDIPYGRYALSFFQDMNMNEKLDKNFLGIPTESIGHSNNPKIFMGPPKFSEASFVVEKENVDFEIIMVH